MNKDEFLKSLENLNINATEEMLEKLEIYCNFLIEYNKHTNLTAIINKDDIYLKHFYDSLTIIKVIDLSTIKNLIDIGTGAGFPGMVLKIFFPNLDVTLLDSNNKKTIFLKSLSEKLNINVNIVNDRVENYSKYNLNKYDVVTSRAVANLRVLSELCLPLTKLEGLFIPLKGMIDDKYEDSLDTINILGAKILKKESFNLKNNSNIRNIIVIKKYKLTNLEDIRSYDKILKKPLVKKR